MFKRETLSFSSVAPDLIPQDGPLDVWTNGRNVYAKNGETLRVGGDLPTLPGATPGARAMAFVSYPTASYWVYGTNAGVFVHDGVTEFDITPATWSQPAVASTVFSATVLAGVVYLSGSDRNPCYWAGDVLSAAQPLPGWPVGGRCLALRAHKNFLFAIGFISEGGQRVRWSDPAELGSVVGAWEPGPDNLAGFVDLMPSGSPCVDGRTLRDSFMIYKQESIWALDFVGGNEVFAVRKMFAEYGAAGANTVTGGIDDVHLFVAASGDVCLTDGVSVRSILEGRAQRTFNDDFSANVDRVFSVATLAREKLGVVIYPSGGDQVGSNALLYDFVGDGIGFREMPGVLCAGEGGILEDVGTINSWDGDPEAWELDSTVWTREVFGQTLDDVLIAGDFGFAAVTGGGGDFVSGPVNASVSKQGLGFGNPQMRKMVTRIWPKVEGRAGDSLFFRIGGQDISGGAISVGSEQEFVIGQEAPLDVFQQGRFLSLDVRSQGGEPWRLGSIDLEYREVGAW